MRRPFIKCLVDLAAHDERIVLLTGDLGYTVVEPFSDRFPDRFFNVGVAEQNMIGLATGLAEAGLIPFVYSIATFATLRAYEFIRNGPIHHHLQVRIIGTGGGFEYGQCGFTHYALEDIGVMRIQPGMTVIVPADEHQAENALRTTWDLPGPIYYRVGKDEDTVVPGLDGRYELGKIQIVRRGKDILLVVMGSIATDVVSAAEALNTCGVASTVVVVDSMNPAPLRDLEQVLSEFKLALSVETHYVVGGLGSLLAEIIADRNIQCRLVRCGVRRLDEGISGSREHLHDKHGLSVERLVSRTLEAMGSIG